MCICLRICLMFVYICVLYSEIGVRTGVPAFYVSFVLAPLASNISEVIASYNYSLVSKSLTTLCFTYLSLSICMSISLSVWLYVCL